MPSEYVDKFAGEVHDHQAKSPAVKPKGSSDDSEDEDDTGLWLDMDEDEDDAGATPVEGDPTDGLRQTVQEAASRSEVSTTQTPSSTLVPSAAPAIFIVCTPATISSCRQRRTPGAQPSA